MKRTKETEERRQETGASEDDKTGKNGQKKENDRKLLFFVHTSHGLRIGAARRQREDERNRCPQHLFFSCLSWLLPFGFAVGSAFLCLSSFPFSKKKFKKNPSQFGPRVDSFSLRNAETGPLKRSRWLETGNR
jgi:hypothetical protein